MKTNQNMRRFLGELRENRLGLSPKLSSILNAGFVEEKGCVLLASEKRDCGSDRTATHDETGYECFVNHVHVESLGEALEFAGRLKKTLTSLFPGDFVVIVSFDGREAIVRFHRLRAGQPGLSENRVDRFRLAGDVLASKRLLRQLLISRVTGKVKTSEIHLDGKGVNQALRLAGTSACAAVSNLTTGVCKHDARSRSHRTSGWAAILGLCRAVYRRSQKVAVWIRSRLRGLSNACAI